MLFSSRCQVCPKDVTNMQISLNPHYHSTEEVPANLVFIKQTGKLQHKQHYKIHQELTASQSLFKRFYFISALKTCTIL